MKNRQGTRHAKSFNTGWVMLALIVLNLAVYAQTRQYDFVDYDDPSYVFENQHVKSGLTWSNAAWAFTHGYQANWHPLTWISHMVDVQLYGMRAGGHHLTNLLLHILNTLLLFAILHRATTGLGQSAFVASLFAVHPLHVESVAWVAERKDVLSTLFWMLALWAYVAYASRQPQFRLGLYLAVLFFFALGLMAKPMLVTLPLVLLLLDFWPLRRMEGATLRRQLPGLFREKLPLIAMSAASSIVTFIVQRQGGAVSSLDRLPLDLRLFNAVESYLAYMQSMIWPTRLTIFYPFPSSFPPVRAGLAVIVLTGITVGVLRGAKRYPYLPVGWFWYLGTLVPVIGLVQVGTQARADHYTYIPLVGLFIIVSWGVPDFMRRWPSMRRSVSIASVYIVVTLTLLGRGQVRYWENSFALWSHAVEAADNNYVGHANLGYFLWKQGKPKEAIAHYEESLRVNPRSAQTLHLLGIALAREERLDEAIARFSEALHVDPGHADTHSDMGILLMRQGKVDEAMVHFYEALRLNPDHANAHDALGRALQKLGRTDEAIHEFGEALRINPGFEAARQELNILRQQGH